MPPVRTNLFEQIPGWREAVEQERVIRDASFLPINETIAGFEVLPMTLRHFLILRMIHSPLLSKSATPSPLELVQFLWVLSPDYAPQNSKARKRFMKRCRAFIPPIRPSRFWFKRNERRWEARYQVAIGKATNLLVAARQYIEDTFQDKPAGIATIDFKPEYYSSAIGICADFGREFGWDDETTLDKPMKRLFQYMNETKEFHDPKAILFNRSDKVTNDWLAAQNRSN